MRELVLDMRYKEIVIKIIAHMNKFEKVAKESISVFYFREENGKLIICPADEDSFHMIRIALKQQKYPFSERPFQTVALA